MKTEEKLLEAFDKFRPHINGHKTAIDLFFEGIAEVEKMQKELNKLRLLNSSLQLKEKGKTDFEDIEGKYKKVEFVEGIGFECMKVNDDWHFFVNGELVQIKNL